MKYIYVSKASLKQHYPHKRRRALCPMAQCAYVKLNINLEEDYQLAFFTPGIRPADAISRNWIREMPN